MVSLDRARRLPQGAQSASRRGGRALAALLVWALVLCWVLGIFILVLTAAAAGSRADGPWWSYVIALVLVVVTVEPVRRWLRRGVEDVVYTHRDDAFAVVTRLNRELEPRRDEHIGESHDDRSSIAAVLARTVGVPYVAVIQDGETTSEAGTRTADRDLTTIPLTYGDQTLGHVLVAPRRPGTPLSANEIGLLTDLAQQLAVGMYAVRASGEVAASRTALVSAREEERRRIRRDLHDGLGPTLAAQRLQLAAARRLLGSDPDRADGILADVVGQMNQTTSDVRRLVYDLRPPLLDELGLVAAIRNHPGSLGPIEVDVAADRLPPLPAAVEVALYRIATEAIHNTVRHSGGQHCLVCISIEDASVHMTVADDGRGLPTPLVAGVGVSGIRERASEIGGTAEWLTNTDGGVTVVTDVPLERAAP
jgi:two-component system, NarL family, sensor kinase